MARNRILSVEQRAEMQVLMELAGLTHAQARYHVLTPDQRAWFQSQIDASKRRRHAESPRVELLKKWRGNHRHHNPELPFTITETDLEWPTHCPVTGVKLVYGGRGANGGRGGRRGASGPNAAALDRIDNTKGCVPGNVVIVSQWVNIRKGDATIEQLQAIVNFYHGR